MSDDDLDPADLADAIEPAPPTDTPDEKFGEAHARPDGTLAIVSSGTEWVASDLVVDLAEAAVADRHPVESLSPPTDATTVSCHVCARPTLRSRAVVPDGMPAQELVCPTCNARYTWTLRGGK